MRNGEVKVGARDRLKITYCCCLVTKLCPTLLHWLQPTRLLWWARILEWVVISLSRGSSWPRDQTQVSCIAGGFFYHWAPGKTTTYTLLCSCCCWITQSCHPTDCNLPGSSVHGISQQEYWSGLPFPSPGDLSDPGIEPMSPALQADSLPLSHLGSLKET